MGRPKITSIDSLVVYPLVEQTVQYYQLIHPNWITMVCIVTKYQALLSLQSLALWQLMFWMLTERYLDCLDGEVARYYNKTSQLGNYLDKYSDVLYRLCMVKHCLYHSYSLFVLNTTWFAFVGLTLLCPLLYVIDYRRGLLSKNMECSGRGIAIYLEDNATLLCFVLPWFLWKLQDSLIYT